MRRIIIVLLAALALAPATVRAGIIGTRAELMSILGADTVTDDFEAFPAPNGAAVNTQVSYIDALSVVAGVGPGLVHPGASYSFVRAPLTWVGSNYNGISTRTIVAWNLGAAASAEVPSSPEDVKLFFAVLISYVVPTPAFGVDLWRFDVMGVVTVEIYDPLGNLINDPIVSIPSLGVPTFFGYADPGGIGAVVVKNTKFPTYWSPNIDNHTYAAAANTPTRKSTWGRLKSLYR